MGYIDSSEIEGIGSAGVPLGGVLSVQGVVGATPIPIAGSFSIAPTTFSSLGQGTPKQVSVGGSSVELLALNPSRLYAHIANNSAHPIFLQYGSPAVVGQGIKLNIGAIWTISTQELWLGSINAISSSGTNLIDVLEGVI